MTSARDDERRVLVVAPTGRDAAVICAVLEQHLPCVALTLLDALAEVARGVGAVVIEEEAITSDDLPAIRRVLDEQEAWSDLPVILLGRSGADGDLPSHDLFGVLRNVTVLERPVRPATLLRSVLSALRARDRQYASRELIRDRELALSQSRQALEALRGSEERFRALVTASSQVLYRMSPDWSEMRELLSRGFLASTEGPSRTWLEKYIPRDEQSRVMAAIDDAIRTKSVFELEHRVIRADGTVGWTLSRAVPLVNAAKEVVEWFGAASDVTDVRNAAEAVRQSEAALDAFFASSPGILNLEDDQFRYLKTDALTPTYFGLSRETILGKSVRDLAPEFIEKFGPMMRRVIETGQPELNMEVESPVPSRSGEVATWRASYFPVPLAGGKRGIGVVGVEITDMKKAEAALHEAARRKNEFLGMLSHELRNPLAPIRNGLYILQRAQPGGEQMRRALEIIDRQVHQVVRLVDDLLDVTRISMGKIRLQRDRIDLKAIARGTVEDHRDIFVKNGIYLAYDATDDSVIVSADPTRVAQIIGNLLQNAAKFTPRGGRANVSVTQSNRFGRVTVVDTGVGISAEMLSKVFEPFTQAETTLDRTAGGLGLGLALVKGLLELQGGSVTVHSQGVGKGATFEASFPIEKRQKPRLVAVRDEPPAHVARRVLVIEDNIDAAETLRVVLEMNDHIVEIAYTGDEGVAKARSFRPDIILCDIGLPGMNGFEVARAIRAAPDLSASVLIALSGYGQPGDIEKSKAAGFNAHLTKPIDHDALERALTHVG